jgi:hypothetical protein
MKPIVDGLENEYGERIDFVYLNIDDPETAAAKEKYGYRVQPHFFLVNAEGDVVDEWLGPVSRDAFVTAFETVLVE